MMRSIVSFLSVAWLLAAPLSAHAKPKLDALLDRQLTALGEREARVVCEEANERQDLCAIAGRAQLDIASCEVAVAECRAQDPGPRIDCSLARFDFGAECTATVSQYLACIEGWNSALACEDFGIWGGPPRIQEACLPLLEACPHFIPEYGDPLSFTPPCDAESSPERVDTDDDVRGLDACRPVPARMVTLGDSIASCFFNVDDDGSRACAPDLIAEQLRASYAPDLVYESYAFPGAVTAQLIDQAMQAVPGPGHVFVWTYMGGNDIGQCSIYEEAEALACLEEKIVQLRAEWEPVLAYFSDASLFPDGATFLLNTQYLPADACEEPGGYGEGITAALTAKVQEYNQRVFVDRALERDDAVAVDQYPDWLGHGRNADNANCPHCYRGDNSSWLSDGVHPSATGQRHIAEKWRVAIDATFAACGGP